MMINVETSVFTLPNGGSVHTNTFAMATNRLTGFRVLLPLLIFLYLYMISCTVTSEDIFIYLLKWDLSVAVYI